VAVIPTPAIDCGHCAGKPALAVTCRTMSLPFRGRPQTWVRPRKSKVVPSVSGWRAPFTAPFPVSSSPNWLSVCRFVDRFVGSRVPSRVSGQPFSTHDTFLPSVGSRRARFPVFIGTMKALRLPARASLMVSVVGSRAPPVFGFAEALLTSAEEARQAWNIWSAGVPCPACCTRGRVRDLARFLATQCYSTWSESTVFMFKKLARSCRRLTAANRSP
jgi:hypothetical protein